METINAADTEWLWGQFVRAYGAPRVRSVYGIRDEDGEWLDELRDFTREDLARGVAVMRRRVEVEPGCFTHTLLEFKAWCYPTDYELGLPGEERAFKLAARGVWDVHPIVYLSVGKMGLYNFNRMDEDQARRRYGKNYRWLVSRVRMGERLVIPTARRHILEYKPEGESAVTVPAKAKDHINVMRRILKGAAA